MAFTARFQLFMTGGVPFGNIKMETGRGFRVHRAHGGPRWMGRQRVWNEVLAC